MKPGIRVVRGPDWRHGNQDGGLGYLGTVVKISRNNTVTVKWDIGTETECRAGADGAFDLRIYDNAQIGCTGVFCDGGGNCKKWNTRTKLFPGIRWKCLRCSDHDYCTVCYMNNVGDECMSHAYLQFLTSRSNVVRLPPRRQSRRTNLYGIFPGAKVTKAASSFRTQHMEGQIQDVGTVKEIINLEPDAYKSAVRVEWSTSKGNLKREGATDLPIYRLGADGKVELTLYELSPEPQFVYLDHLPVLDLTMPVDISINVGDEVRVDLNLETFRFLQKECNAWDDKMEVVLGEVGKVLAIGGNRTAAVKYRDHTVPAIYINSLTKISRLQAGDIVRIIDDEKKVRKAQEGHGGWQSACSFLLGQQGRLARIDESGDALVEVLDQTYVFNQSCLVLVSRGSESRPDLSQRPTDKNKTDNKTPLDASITTPSRPQRRGRRVNPENPVGVGVRVVRGADWNFGDQDGGEGHVGTLIEVCGETENDPYPAQCVIVLWDNGERNVYRAGHEKAHDLKLFDNAPVGVKHDVQCSNCGIKEIVGMMWICTSCDGYNLCSECYHGSKHDISHIFKRVDAKGASGVSVPARKMARTKKAYGIFEKAKVTRGPDWRWHNQDGGSGKTGEVIAIVNFSPDTDHDAAEVTWDNGYTNVYRLGYRGRLDVQVTKASTWGFYYKDHLPDLKVTEKAVKKPAAAALLKQVSEEKKLEPTAAKDSNGDNRIQQGDRVRIEIEPDILKMMEQGRGNWNERMSECIGKTGMVVVVRGQDITVDFDDAGRWTFHEASLSKVREFVPGEVVQVNESLDHVRMLQTDRGGWNDMMKKVIGKRGRVEEVDEDGDVQVSFGEYTWTFNPECLGPTDQAPEIVHYSDGDEEVEEPPKPPPKDTEDDETTFFTAVMEGDAAKVRRIVERKPELLFIQLKGKPALHLASNLGHMDVVKFFIEQGVDKELVDDDQCTALLAAVKGEQHEVIKYLVSKGVKKDAKNQSQQSAVHIAVHQKDVKCLQLLRDLKFDINNKDLLDQSAVFDAITSKDKAMLSTVLEWPGIDVVYQDKIGFSPFCFACKAGDMFAVQKILELSPDELNNPKPDGFTGLHLAVFNSNMDIVNFLLNQENIDVDAQTNDGTTPLHIAAMDGLLDLAKLLVNKGADVEIQDNSGNNCLHLCLTGKEEENANMFQKAELQDHEKRRIDLAKFLIGQGKDLNIKNKDNKTPADIIIPDKIKEMLGFKTSARQAAAPRNVPQCVSCEEEEAEFTVVPCGHQLCSDCTGTKKKKIKRCPECGAKVDEIKGISE